MMKSKRTKQAVNQLFYRTNRLQESLKEIQDTLADIQTKLEKRRNGIKLFALNATTRWGMEVAEFLDLPLSKHEEFSFPDGESYLRSGENVRRSSAFVIQSLYSDSRETVDQKLNKLLLFAGALRDASADEVCVVIPYLAYARSDRKVKSREGVATKYVAQMLESIGVDRVLTIDIHNLGAFQNAYRIRTDNLECKNLFADFMVAELEGIDPKTVSVLAADAGGFGRASRFRNALQKRLKIDDVPVAVVDKSRMGKVVKGTSIAGQVRPVTILVEDMIASGSTIKQSVAVAKEHGAERIYAVATHGLFVGNADENLADNSLYKIIVSDTIDPFRLGDAARQKLYVISTAKLFAEAIRRSYTGESLSSLFE